MHSNDSITVRICSMYYIHHGLIAEMLSIMLWCEDNVCACPRRHRCPGCIKQRSFARGDGLDILRACPTNLRLNWRRVFDGDVAPAILVNSALDMPSGKRTLRA